MDPSKNTNYQTPPQRIYEQGKYSHSPFTPYPTKFAFASPHSVTESSAQPTLVKGLTAEEVKTMSKLWNTPSQILDLLLQFIPHYTDEVADVEKVTNILAKVLQMTVPIPLFQIPRLTSSEQGEELLRFDRLRRTKDASCWVRRINSLDCWAIAKRFLSRISSFSSDASLYFEQEYGRWV